MAITHTEQWPVANVVPAPSAAFTCWAFDSAGQWVPTDGSVTPEIRQGAEIGLKASHPVPGISLGAETVMLFTFTSPSGIQTEIEKRSTAPIVIDGTAVEWAFMPADELGLWVCSVQYWEADNYDAWGPFPMAEVTENGPANGNGGVSDDFLRNMLIVAGVGAALLFLSRRE